MAGTDAYIEAASPTLDLEVRKAVQRLRTLLVINPGKCHLFTRGPWPASNGHTMIIERWLSDRYVMVNVTGDKTLRAERDLVTADLKLSPEWPDGLYKLTAGKGLVPCDELPFSDSAGLLDNIERPGDWRRMERTRWQVADSPANLMLAYAFRLGERRIPLAVNEGIWAAFAAAFRDLTETEPQVGFDYCAERPYRVTFNGIIVGYVASAHFPEDQQKIAQTIVDGV
jgi:hypothetical protein